MQYAWPEIDYAQLTQGWESFSNGAVTVSISLLRIMGANTLFMDNSEHITYQLPYFQDHESLRRHWLSFSKWDSDRVACSFALKGCQYGGYA